MGTTKSEPPTKRTGSREKNLQVILLTGTYESLQRLPPSGQLASGTLPGHLIRYRAVNPNGQRTFRAVLLTIQQAPQIPTKPPLVDHAEFLYGGNLGCVGLLTCWLNRGLALAVEPNSNRMTVETAAQLGNKKPSYVEI